MRLVLVLVLGVVAVDADVDATDDVFLSVVAVILVDKLGARRFISIKVLVMIYIHTHALSE